MHVFDGILFSVGSFNDSGLSVDGGLQDFDRGVGLVAVLHEIVIVQNRHHQCLPEVGRVFVILGDERHDVYIQCVFHRFPVIGQFNFHIGRSCHISPFAHQVELLHLSEAVIFILV